MFEHVRALQRTELNDGSSDSPRIATIIKTSGCTHNASRHQHQGNKVFENSLTHSLSHGTHDRCEHIRPTNMSTSGVKTFQTRKADGAAVYRRNGSSPSSLQLTLTEQRRVVEIRRSSHSAIYITYILYVRSIQTEYYILNLILIFVILYTYICPLP